MRSVQGRCRGATGGVSFSLTMAHPASVKPPSPFEHMQAKLKDELLSLSEQLHGAQHELGRVSAMLRKKRDIEAEMQRLEEQCAGEV